MTRRPGESSAPALPVKVGYRQPLSPLSTQFLDQGFVALQLKDHHLNLRLGPEPRPNMFTDVHRPPLAHSGHSRTVQSMDKLFRLGALVITNDRNEATQIASLLRTKPIRSIEDMRNESGQGVVSVDTDDLEMQQIVDIASRFRSQGVGLMVTSRPTTNIPFTLEQNLSSLLDLTEPIVRLPHV